MNDLKSYSTKNLTFKIRKEISRFRTLGFMTLLISSLGLLLVFNPFFIASFVITPVQNVRSVSGPPLVILADVYLVNQLTNQSSDEISKIIMGINRIWRLYGIELSVINEIPLQVPESVERIGSRVGDINKDAEDLGEYAKEGFHDSKIDIFIIKQFNDSSLGGIGLVNGNKKIGALFVSVKGFDAWVISHELGHVLGLKHTCNANLMIADFELCGASFFKQIFHPVDLTPSQVKTAREYVRERFSYKETLP